MAIERIVDAHIHLWDPARPDWYPLLVGKRTPPPHMGDISGMCRRFDTATYLTESARWNVEKFINIAAADSSYTLAETASLEAEASKSGHPDATVGGVTPSDSIADMEKMLDIQMESPRFRGIRIMGPRTSGFSYERLLGALQERKLVYDLMVHPATMAEEAEVLAAFQDLAVVVEHTGWPTSDTQEEYEIWKTGMSKLASLSPKVCCKLSGLAMPLGTMDAAAFRPWIEHAVEVFGAERCMVASNFPVDGLHGTFDELYSSFDIVTLGLDPADREQLFARTAERVYGC
jgi:L-fuconolactonase